MNRDTLDEALAALGIKSLHVRQAGQARTRPAEAVRAKLKELRDTPQTRRKLAELINRCVEDAAQTAATNVWFFK